MHLPEGVKLGEQQINITPSDNICFIHLVLYKCSVLFLSMRILQAKIMD